MHQLMVLVAVDDLHLIEQCCAADASMQAEPSHAGHGSHLTGTISLLNSQARSEF